LFERLAALPSGGLSQRWTAPGGINYVTGATYGPDSALTGFISGNSGTFAGILRVQEHLQISIRKET